MNVYIGGTKSYSAMQGPCPSGFHVPTKDDWEGVKSIMEGLSLTTGNYWGTYLKLPTAGCREYNSSNTYAQGAFGYYWSSTPSSLKSYFVLFNYSVVRIQEEIRSYGYSIRPFKDSFVVPTSGWTTLYGTLGSTGIFWNSTDGIISITSNGTTGYTIADKNLGATSVYSDGNTLSQSKCGYYYQRGNNNGFAWTGSVATSSTKVDASTYGPGNYYNSSTFINNTGGWDSSNNTNLWGYNALGELKNAYIGEVVYCDFTQGDCGFTFSKKTGAINSYGRNSNGFYGINSSSYNQAISWKPPQSLYTKGPIKKIEIQAKTTTAGGGCGISYNLDTYYCRVWWQGNMKNWTGTNTVETLTSEPPANTTFTFTVDFVNKIQIYSIEPSKTIVLTDAEITTIQNYWSNGTLDICAMLRNISGTTTYIQNATFYF